MRAPSGHLKTKKANHVILIKDMFARTLITRSDCVHKTQCRVCGKSQFVEILDLGAMPPANSFLMAHDLLQKERKFPLKVYFCNYCGLLQLRDVVNPSILFSHYDYFTSTSAPLARHFLEFGKQLAKKFIKAKDDLVLEIGGNDGILLSTIRNHCRVLNIEPAKNIAGVSRKNGIETINDFFTSALAENIFKKHGKARLIVANNVLAHIDDVRDVFRGVKMLLDDAGTFVFEVHWLGNLIGDGGFDQIYHEHVCYFSLSALQYLIQKSELVITDAELIPIHGQSLRVYVGHGSVASGAVNALLEREKVLGLNSTEVFHAFAEKTKRSRNQLRELLVQLKKNGKIIAGYGAPAKGNTLLNYCGIDGMLVDFIIDTTPAKQGLYTPGSHIPIYPPEKMRETPPDYVVLLAWNYADAIISREADFRERGGRFIVPVPEVRII